MITYGIMTGFTFFMYLMMPYCSSDRKKQNEVTISVFFVIYIVLLCLRNSDVGVDTKNYLSRYFYPAQKLSLGELFTRIEVEKGFLILTKIISFIGNERFFIAVLAILAVTPILYFYRKESSDALLCCSFFLISLLFEMFFSGMRQGLAIGLAVPAFYFAMKKKWLWFALTVFIAVSFHMSAWILILLLPFCHLKITRKWLWFVIPVMVLVYVYRTPIFSYLLQWVGEDYAEGYTYLTVDSSGQMGLMILFVLLSAYCYIMLDESKADQMDIGLNR